MIRCFVSNESPIKLSRRLDYTARLTCQGSCLFSLFFFFQAEDGIRDLTVTGVQTCALPIFDCAGLEGADAVIHLAGENVSGRWTPAKKQRIRDSRVLGTRIVSDAIADLRRSEERRVGKECRSRWSPYH